MNCFNKMLAGIIATICLTVISCKKFVTIPPPSNQLVSPLPFEDDATATATITGIYSEMIRGTQQFSSGFTTLYAGMSADELYYFSPSSRDEFVMNQITPANHANLTSYFWQPAYKFIYAANLILEQLQNSGKVSPATKSTLIAEAKFIRAFCYFYLVNLFGGVPLTLSPDYSKNALLAAASESLIYQQIINDLEEAQSILSASYPTTERIRPNKWTIKALLARTYLYQKDWSKAQENASAIIAAGNYVLETNLNNVFLGTSREAIWQLKPVNPSFNTHEGNAILPATAAAAPKYLVTSSLLNSFEATDRRKSIWLKQIVYTGDTLYVPYKYKVFGNSAPLTEYYMVFRLAEMLLINAEAKAQQNDIAGALADLNVIRNRAGLPDESITEQSSLLDAIQKERRIELFAEWGHRWFDLIRTGTVDAVLGLLKPSTWQPTDTLWPVPQDQINLNPALRQNPGY